MDNKAIVRRFFDLLSTGQLGQIRELMSAEYPGAATFEETITALRTAFPDIHYVVHDVLAEADRVAVRWTWTGTHLGPFRTHTATQKVVKDTAGFGFFTLREGRITNIELLTDRLGFLQQIGAAP